MAINLIRIDDRLIHGQIVHVWIEFARANYLVVADDAVVKDSMQQMLLRLAAPKTVKLEMLSLEDAVAFSKEHEADSIFMICRNPESMLKLLEYGLDVKEVNLGNISQTKSEKPRKTLLKNIHVNETDVVCLREIAARGVNIYIKLVPDDHATDAIDLLNKKY